MLTDTSRPSEGVCAEGRIESVVMQIPRQTLGLSTDRVDRLLARDLATDVGSGAILADFLRTLFIRGPECDPEELRGAGSVALDLATAFLARRLGDQPLTVAAHIRQSRLEHAYADLARGELGGRSVQTIAARWGFSSATGFSRAFREAYGMPPTEHRALSLHAEDRNPARHAHHRAPLGPTFSAGDSATA
ncbi:AraC family transcriptional regulator [Streptomyces sp. NPDC056361]|uniref:AraC family transcriptional regulator n=1 Tax=Streptomyces sp. NPDC056361 TaxID=3345795 RepID=UPI0035DAA59C